MSGPVCAVLVAMFVVFGLILSFFTCLTCCVDSLCYFWGFLGVFVS